MSYSVGDTVVLDGIESVIIYDNGSEADWGRYICVDKNHDLSYYISGSDYVDESESDLIINNDNAYGYEWGGYETDLGMTDSSYREIGKGLSNTNSLISKNLTPNTSGWRVLWDMIEEFRVSHSNYWFIPSLEEAKAARNQKNHLENITTTAGKCTNYWTSSENSSNHAWPFLFVTGTTTAHSKNSHNIRSRLCRYTTDQELNSLSKQIQITTTTDQASIYYTLDNSTPTSNSTLYNNTFQVQTGTTIKAIGIKEGYIDSDIATLTV